MPADFLVYAPGRQRLEAIANERRAIAKRIFEGWLSDLRRIIGASEHGLFISLLDKAKTEMYSFQDHHGLQGTLDQPYGFLVKDSHIQDLTADEHSEEWKSGTTWYSGRRR